MTYLDSCFHLRKLERRIQVKGWELRSQSPVSVISASWPMGSRLHTGAGKGRKTVPRELRVHILKPPELLLLLRVSALC